jgi:hypothetical protein
MSEEQLFLVQMSEEMSDWNYAESFTSFNIRLGFYCRPSILAFYKTAASVTNNCIANLPLDVIPIV